MATNDYLSGQPYYDDYDADKGFIQIAAVPGRTEQAREFTQAQTIQRDYLSRLGNAIFANGTILSGCSLIINNKTATITAGTMFLDGLVRNIKATSLVITGVGYEYIGARIKTELITENEDQTLRDPAQNYENAGQAGAHRVRETVEFVVMTASSSGTSDTSNTTSASATTIYTIYNGEISRAESVASDDSLLYETLARRSYDENGSFKVEGLELRDRGEATSEGILVSVSDGKAYVKGFEVTKTSATTVTLEFATDIRSILSEPIRFLGSHQLIYTLNASPVKQINRVSCLLEYTETISHSNIRGGSDYLTQSSIDTILEVRSGANYFVQGDDFNFMGDSLDWSPSGNEPTTGGSYQVTYWYWADLVEGTDYELVAETNSSTGQYESKLKLKNNSKLPVTSNDYKGAATVRVDYDYYLARKDLITMDQQGLFTVYKGVPNLLRVVESPVNQDLTKLVIGTVLIYPGYSGPDAESVLKSVRTSTHESTRLSQANLCALKRRVDDLEYNVAMSDLDKEAADGEAPTQLKGVFTDGFIGLTKADSGHQDFDCTIDLDMSELTLPTTSFIQSVTPNESTTETTAHRFDGMAHNSNNPNSYNAIYMAPYDDVVVAAQIHATERMLVNPYAVYNPLGLIKLTPNVDNWIDTSTVVVNESKTVSTTLRRWWKHRGDSWAEAEKQKWLQLTGTTGEQLNWANYKGSTTTSTSAMILDEAVMYMRQQVINVTGSNFNANADNIEGYFNDTQVRLTPTGSTRAGTNAGTVKANAKGKFTAKFTIPANVPCGTVDVVFKNGTNTSSTTYTAQGRKQVIQETVLTTKISVKTKDPLAQTFQFDTDTILTKVGLFFATKDSARNVVLQIRNTDNGYPGTIVYDEVFVDSGDINTSTNGTAQTIINLSQPVYCYADTQYSICVLSDSNEYELWIATLGQRNAANNIYVTSQPYTGGVLFSSSDAKAWTAHQMSDLKFNLYAAQYNGNPGVLRFDNVSTNVMNRLLIAAQSIDYQNNGISWYYRIASADPWLPIETYVDQELNARIQTVQLKVEMTPTRSTSPILAGSTVNLIGFIEKTSGAYVSRTITLDNPFDTIVVTIEAMTPSGTNFDIQYMAWNSGNSTLGNNWSALTPSGDPVLLSSDGGEQWYRHTYKATDLAANCNACKYKINMSTTNPLTRPRLRKFTTVMRTENS